MWQFNGTFEKQQELSIKKLNIEKQQKLSIYSCYIPNKMGTHKPINQDTGVMKKKLMTATLISFGLMSMTGCSFPWKSSRGNQQTLTDYGPKQINIINYTRYDQLIRLGLEKHGFDVAQNDDSNVLGLEIIVGEEIDWCKGRPSKQLDKVIYKVVDHRQNKNVLILEKGGWTGECGLSKTDVFERLAIMLDDHWSRPDENRFAW